MKAKLDWNSGKELLAQTVSDVGFPDTVSQTFGWTFKFVLRLWDDRVVKEWAVAKRELNSGNRVLMLDEYEPYVAEKVGRSRNSVHRSLQRIWNWYEGEGAEKYLSVPHVHSRRLSSRFSRC